MEDFDLNGLVDQLARAKDINRAVVVEALEAALTSASKRSHLNIPEMDIHLLDEEGKLVIIARRTVVEEVTRPGLEIALAEARSVDPEAEVGDEMDVEVSPAIFGRNAAQIAKQVVIQRLREAERVVILAEYQKRVGEVVSGVIKREAKGTVVVDLGRTEAVMPYRERVPGEEYRVGDRVRAYLTEVKETTKGAQIILSRAHPNFLNKLFELEVPEIYEGVVRIHAVAREPGSRSKVAVSSRDKNVDPVGTCVGMRGYRVQAVVRELSGEKVDIVRFSPSTEEFARNALAPAQISDIEVNEEGRHVLVVVPENQLSLAIGKGGQNVRLATKLLNWRLDIISEREKEDVTAREEAEAAASYDFLIAIPGVGEKMALSLYEYGFGTPDAILAATPEELSAVPGLGPKKMASLKEKVAARLAELAALGQEPPKPEDYLTPAPTKEEVISVPEEAAEPAETPGENAGTGAGAPPQPVAADGDEPTEAAPADDGAVEGEDENRG